MKDIKMIKVIGYRLWVIGVLMGALMVSAPTKAQFSSNQYSEFSNQTVAPSTTFQSTSSLSGSGSAYSSNPTIGDNGTAIAPSSPRIRTIGQRRNEGDDEDNPIIDEENDPYGNPIGDVVLPLLALAMVYGVWCMVYRRKRRA